METGVTEGQDTLKLALTWKTDATEYSANGKSQLTHNLVKT